MQQQHHYQQLIDLFDSCFAEEFNTRLIKGDDEPIYLPADDETPYHRIVFAHGFFARVMTLLEQGIPERPARFIRALQHYYQTPPLTAKHFPWPEDLH